VYLRCLDYLSELIETPLDQPPPKPETYGEMMVEALMKVAVGGDPGAARCVLEMLASHDETLANANMDDGEADE
jgi:hypothetical protein